METIAKFYPISMQSMKLLSKFDNIDIIAGILSLWNTRFHYGLSMFLSALSQLILKPACSSCGRPAVAVFCECCHGQIFTGKRSQPLEPASSQHPFPLFAWATYDNSLRRAIAALKYDRQSAIGHWLGIQMAESWIQAGLHRQYPQLLVVPIPMHPSKQKLRGYNQAELISRSFARQVGYRHQPQILRRHRETQAQYSVRATDRDRNLQSAFSVEVRGSCQQRILLIDDIYTTGATLRSAIQVLQAHNLNLWGSAVAAKVCFEDFSRNIPQSSPKLKKIKII